MSGSIEPFFNLIPAELFDHRAAMGTMGEEIGSGHFTQQFVDLLSI